MTLKIISAILTVFLIVSCAPRQAIKEEAKEVAPTPEEIKLPELPQKPAEEIKKVEPLRIEKEAEEKYVILNFDGADIETVISTIGELLNINYILAPGISGKVTIQSYRKFPVRDLFQIFQTILELNGITAVKDGTLYRIVPIDTAKQQPLSIQTGKELKLQIDSSFVTQIIPLEYVRANDAANVVRNLMPRGTDLIVYEPTNLLIVTAQPAGLVKFMKLVEAIDVSTADRESIRTFVYYVENGDAKKLEGILKTLYAEKKEKTVAAKPAPPPTVPAKGAPSVLVEGLPGEVEGEIVITAYEDINGLIIKASPRSYLAILETLKKLDVPVKQVLIEVLIAEVTLKDETQFGIEWVLKGKTDVFGRSADLLGGFASAPGNFFKKDTFDFQPIVSGEGVFANILDATRFNALISAVEEIGKLNVLASPHILAMDNKEASIQIGDEVPVATGTQTAGTVGQSITVQYKTVGTLLTVKPRITEKNRVTLDITQEVSGRGETAFIADQKFEGFNTRKAKTTAVVQSGHTLVIGGLIRETKDHDRIGIPLLSKIPLLGYLFSTTTDKYNKTELILMVTPHVVSNQEEADAITKDFQNKVKTIKERLEKIKPDEASSAEKGKRNRRSTTRKEGGE